MSLNNGMWTVKLSLPKPVENIEIVHDLDFLAPKNSTQSFLNKDEEIINKYINYKNEQLKRKTS